MRQAWFVMDDVGAEQHVGEGLSCSQTASYYASGPHVGILPHELPPELVSQPGWAARPTRVPAEKAGQSRAPASCSSARTAKLAPHRIDVCLRSESLAATAAAAGACVVIQRPLRHRARRDRADANRSRLEHPHARKHSFFRHAPRCSAAASAAPSSSTMR